MAKKSLLDQILDENNSAPTTIYNENNEPLQFDQVFVYPVVNGEEIERLFVILKPLEPEKLGMPEDEGLVFEYIDTDEGETLNIVTDEDTINEVFDYYEQMYAEENA